MSAVSPESVLNFQCARFTQLHSAGWAGAPGPEQPPWSCSTRVPLVPPAGPTDRSGRPAARRPCEGPSAVTPGGPATCAQSCTDGFRSRGRPPTPGRVCTPQCVASVAWGHDAREDRTMTAAGKAKQSEARREQKWAISQPKLLWLLFVSTWRCNRVSSQCSPYRPGGARPTNQIQHWLIDTARETLAPRMWSTMCSGRMDQQSASARWHPATQVAIRLAMRAAWRGIRQVVMRTSPIRRRP